MAIYAEKKDGENFIQIEPGTYMARCYSMIQIGTIETEFEGKKKKAHKVSITWELPDELAVFNEDKGPEPFVVSKTYTLSMHEKATLRHDLESWRGKGYTEEEARKFDITKLLGQPCILSVIHQPGITDSSKNYVKVTSISKLMKGQECPPQINPMRVLSYDTFDWEVFESLSDYMKDKIKSSDEFKSLQEPNQTRDENDNSNDDLSDLPFILTMPIALGLLTQFIF
ncbi:MAG TPA: hypothetical protein VMV77_09005 [Bacteroidales bacterium]|nr:hypothetical protein [Bacteroidales bacterium]